MATSSPICPTVLGSTAGCGRNSTWTGYFLAQPTVLGVADSYGIELRHPVREGRRPGQIGKKGKSNHRWIVGASCASCSTNWDWWLIGIVTPPTSTTKLSNLCSPTMMVR